MIKSNRKQINISLYEENILSAAAALKILSSWISIEVLVSLSDTDYGLKY